jgi:ATP-dependent Lon protease
MTYRLIALDEAIVFPTVTATLPIDVGEEERVFLIPRRADEYGRVGVVAEVIETGLSRRGRPVATVVGLHRGLIAGSAQPGDGETLRVEVQEIRDGHPDDEHTRELSREYRAVVEEILELRGDDGRIAA